MFTVRRSLVTALVASAICAPSALAQGGRGGGTVPTQFPPAACDGSGDGPTALGTVVTLPIRDANCLSLLVSSSGSITVSAVTAAPGWSFNVKRDQPNEIDVIWTNVANPALTHEYRRSDNSVRVS